AAAGDWERGLAADDGALSGMIIADAGSTIVAGGAAGETPVIINSATKIRGTAGALGVRGEEHPATPLVRGLAVEVTAVQTGADLTAMQVTFKNSDLKTAQQIAAGIVVTEDQVAKNAAGIAEN